MKERVVILGASPNRERYSNMAQRLLMERGYRVIPVNPGQSQIEGVEVIRHLSNVPTPVDTVTMYVNSEISLKLQEDVLRLNPRRVVFNPGSETPLLAAALREQGVSVVEACTLVMIRTDQW